MKNKLFLISLAIVVAVAGAFYGLSKMNQAPPASAQTTGDSTAGGGFSMVPRDNAILIKSHAAVKGPLTAKVTVVEFLDPECEACAAMSPIVKKVMQEHEGDVKLVVRYLPLHGNSRYVANILEGAKAQNKYWETMEALFVTQNRWAQHGDPKPEEIPAILEAVNLKDLNKIIADAKAGKYDALITEDLEDAKKLGIRGTPTFFINGHELENLGYGPLKEAITSKL